MAAEDPVEAGVPRTKDGPRAYQGEGIVVRWDATRCIHTGICLQRLPQVFDTTARPWVNLAGAPAEDVAAAVRACPTGALRYDGDDGDADQPPVIEVRPNGPLFVRGRVRLTAPGGRAATTEPRVALCRCGASENKPFCDNSHRLVGFRDASSARPAIA